MVEWGTNCMLGFEAEQTGEQGTVTPLQRCPLSWVACPVLNFGQGIPGKQMSHQALAIAR